MGERTLRAEQGSTDAPGEVKAMMRPERLRVEPHGSDGENRILGMVEHAVFLGSFRELRVRLLGGSPVKAIIPNDGTSLGYAEGEPLTLHLPRDALRVLAASASADSGRSAPPPPSGG